MSSLRKHPFTVGSLLIITVLCVVSLLLWVDYCYDIDFVTALSAVAMLPHFVIVWILELNVVGFIQRHYIPLAGLVGFLVLVLIKGWGIMKIPEKDDR